MSRSYKKSPVCTDGRVGTTKEMKNFANKKIRKKKVDEEIPRGGAYKKYSESWDIHDYVTMETWAEAKNWYEKNQENPYIKKYYPTIKHFYRNWRKYYMNK